MEKIIDIGNYDALRGLRKRVESPIVLSVKVWTAEEIDQTIASNLRRIRSERGLSQGEVAELIEIEKTKISAWENLHEGMGKKAMALLCNKLNLQPWEFYITEQTPIVRDEAERQDLFRMREAQALGLGKQIREAEAVWIEAAKRTAPPADTRIRQKLRVLAEKRKKEKDEKQ